MFQGLLDCQSFDERYFHIIFSQIFVKSDLHENIHEDFFLYSISIFNLFQMMDNSLRESRLHNVYQGEVLQSHLPLLFGLFYGFMNDF